MQNTNIQKHFRTCNLCEAMCGLVIEHDGKKVHSIRGDKDDPFSEGYICPKAVALQDIYEDPDRLKMPVKKIDGKWVEISWEQAFDEVAENLLKIREKYGNDAIGVFQGNPSVHNYGTMMFSPNLLRTIKTRNHFSATSTDQLPHHVAAKFMLGHYLLMPIPDIDHTDFFLVFGANPMASNGSVMTAPGMPQRLKALQARGGKFVVIDPRKSETAVKADQHYFIKPGSDVLLLLAMVNTIFEKDLVDLRHLKDVVEGMAILKPAVRSFTPENVSEHLGMEAQEIRQLTMDFAKAKSAVCYGRMGVSTQEFGSICQWLVNVLNIITGNFDHPGGAMFTNPAVDILQFTGAGKMGRWKSRIRELPEFFGELPVAVLAEEILEEGEGQIKAMVTSAGNPVLSTPNGQQLDKAMEKLEFMVSIDIYINETTRHANIILPPATGLEVNHYDLIFHNLAIRNTAKYSSALFQPAPGAKYDWQIFRELILRLGGEKNILPLKPWGTPEKMLDMALRVGPYGQIKKDGFNFGGLSLRKLENSPHGVDYGPLKSCLPARLFTKDKKIPLTPAVFTDGLESLLSHFEEKNGQVNGFAFSLIGRRHLRSNNSWMHNSERLVKGGDRCTLMMHPDDAVKVGLEDKQPVRVTSRTGEISLNLEVTDTMMPGVVSIPHGWGHARQGVQLNVAINHAGASLNDLTDHLRLDSISGNAAFSGVPVKVTAV